jgi:hypothetical protein
MNDSIIIHKAFSKKLDAIHNQSDEELIASCKRIFDTLQTICQCDDIMLLDVMIMDSLFYHYSLLELDKRGVTPP